MSVRKESGEEILQPHVRPVTDIDRKRLPTFSHSRLECFENCPFSFYRKYIQEKVTYESTIALESGSLAHKLLELKKYMLDARNVDYKKLSDVLENGYHPSDKSEENLIGRKAIRRKYLEDYLFPDSEGRTYTEKWNLFDHVLHSEMEDDAWEPYLAEHYFEFVWDDRVILHGYIDRIDQHGVDLRCIDYKTAKKLYDTKKLATSQQFGIYACGILNEFGKLPVQSIYRMVFLDDRQYALTKGWEKRFIKKINKVLDDIDECKKNGIWTPSPSPLCYWCNYCESNPNAKQYNHECPFYSMWTPNGKSFEVNQDFDPWYFIEANKPKLNKKRLVF